MAWIVVALLSAATFGMVTVLDKRLIDKHMPSLPSLYMSVGVSLFLYGSLAAIFAGIPTDASLDRLLAAAASGGAWGGALGLMFLGYRMEEASRASATIHTFPVFVALLAIPLLGEALVPGQWLAVVVVVAGAFLISLRGSAHRRVLRLNKAFPVLLGASLFIALAHLSSKYALAEVPPFSVYALRNFAMGAVFLTFWRRATVGHLFQVVRSKETLLWLGLAEFSLAPLASFLTILAADLGPISLVATLTATRPFYVFLYSTILSVPALRLLEEPLERNTLVVKLASIIMIVGGVGALTLL